MKYDAEIYRRRSKKIKEKMANWRFAVPKVSGVGRGVATLWGAGAWYFRVKDSFFIEYRIYKDGGHHFLKHHSWEDPKVIAYLEEVDKKYPGSKLATANMHH